MSFWSPTAWPAAHPTSGCGDRLAAFDGGSPRELAQALIDDSGAQVGAADDRTALVLKLARRSG